MFFSIIIPTYNPRKYLHAMLESITHNKCANELEVIISDDCSTEQFDDILNSFDLNIKKITNKKHTGFPRTGRQNGVEIAQGEWITFADQDDYYLDGCFDLVKEYITQHNIKYYIGFPIIKESTITGQTIIESASYAWTHGKFTNRILWDKYGLKYDAVDYCEDSNIVTKINCLLFSMDEEIIYAEDPVYVWCAREESLSNRNNAEYFIKSMPDYIKGTLKVVLSYLKKKSNTPKQSEQYRLSFMFTLYHIFFYLQAHHMYNYKKEMINTISYMIPIVEEFKELMNYTTEDIIMLTNTEYLHNYNAARTSDCNEVPFIEQMSFKDWMNLYF